MRYVRRKLIGMLLGRSKNRRVLIYRVLLSVILHSAATNDEIQMETYEITFSTH